jgi:hypothetical protein
MDRQCTQSPPRRETSFRPALPSMLLRLAFRAPRTARKLIWSCTATAAGNASGGGTMVKPPVATPTVVSPPVTLFPPAPTTTFSRDPKLQAALDGAIAKICAKRKIAVTDFPTPISIIDLKSAASGATGLPIAGFNDTTREDYIASAGKVGVLYAAFAIRDMVRRFAFAAKPKDEKDLFAQLDAQMGPAIAAAVPRVTLKEPIVKPNYASMIEASKLGSGLNINFKRDYETNLDGMIVKGQNLPTSKCVHGVGYGYMNGTFAAHKFFKDPGGLGLWVATDYNATRTKVFINTVNASGSEAVASTSCAMAQLLAVIIVGGVLSDAVCAEMRRRLKGAVASNGGDDQSWLTRSSVTHFIPDAALTHDKVGLGTITVGKMAGTPIESEILALDVGQIPDLPGSKKFAIAYQNMRQSERADIVAIIRETITAYGP